LASTRRNRYPNGDAKVGFIPTIRAAGFNGTADIIAGAAVRMTYGKLAVGAQFGATWRN